MSKSPNKSNSPLPMTRPTNLRDVVSENIAKTVNKHGNEILPAEPNTSISNMIVTDECMRLFKELMEVYQEMNIKLDQRNSEIEFDQLETEQHLEEFPVQVHDELPSRIERTLRPKNIDSDVMHNVSFALPNTQSTRIIDHTTQPDPSSRVSFAEGNRTTDEQPNVNPMPSRVNPTSCQYHHEDITRLEKHQIRIRPIEHPCPGHVNVIRPEIQTIFPMHSTSPSPERELDPTHLQESIPNIPVFHPEVYPEKIGKYHHFRYPFDLKEPMRISKAKPYQIPRDLIITSCNRPDHLKHPLEVMHRLQLAGFSFGT